MFTLFEDPRILSEMEMIERALLDTFDKTLQDEPLLGKLGIPTKN
jgi:hypothetical protein